MVKYYPISPTIDIVAPNLGEAARKANLTPDQMGQVEQIAWTIKQNKKLLALPQDKARKKFSSLDPEVQDAIKVLFPNSAYTKEPDNSVLGYARGALKDAVSPIVGIFKLAGKYNQAINMPYKVVRGLAEGKDPFKFQTYRDAWDGINQFDREAFKEVEDFFGKEKAYVAKGIIEGRTPGEIIEAYGKISPQLLSAIEEAFSNPEKFRQVLDGVKYAQFSPGRDIARMRDRKPPKNGGLYGDYIDGTTKDISGRIDFIYQIAIDPLTWFTGGSSKAVTKGAQIAELVKQYGATQGVYRAFQQNGSLRKLWDKQLGPGIEKFARAKTDGERALIRRELARSFPLYDDEEALFALAAGKVFNADRAVGFFSMAENTQLLLSGRVDGITYQRNGVVLARRFRRQRDAFGKWMDKKFFGADFDDAQLLDSAGDDLMKNLTAAGTLEDYSINPAMQSLGEFSRDIGAMRKIGLLASRNPSGEILVGENAIKTANNFRTLARQILPRDMAEFVTQKFLKSEISDQIVILRNLDTAILYRYGLGGHPEGLALVDNILREKYGNATGYGLTTSVDVPSFLVNAVPSGALRKDGGKNVLNSVGPIHDGQLSYAFGPLPYEQLNALNWAARGRTSLLANVFGKTTHSALSRSAVDIWSVFTLAPRHGVRTSIDESFFFAITAPGRNLAKYAMQGKAFSNVITAYTGSKSAVGPVRELIGKITKKNVFDSISVEDRKKFLETLSEGGISTVDDADMLLLKEMTGQRALELFGKEIDDIDKKYLLSLMVNSPDIRTSMARSVSAKTGISGNLDHEIYDQLFTESMLTAAAKELEVKLGKTFRSFPAEKIKRINKKYLTLAHYDNWFRMFVPKGRVLSKKQDGTPDKFVDVVNPFLANNALRTEEDFITARRVIMDNIGVRFFDDINDFKVIDEASVQKFLEPYAKTAEFAQKGISKENAVNILVTRMLIDMRNTFHGGANEFNEVFYQLIKSRYDDLVAASEKRGVSVSRKWQKAASTIDFNKFEEVTVGFQPKGEVNTAIEIEDLVDDGVGRLQKLGTNIMEYMDRQVNGIFRQPAVVVTAVQIRKSYAKIEEDFVRQTFKSLKENSKNKTDAQLLTIAKSIADRRFNEIATQEAADTILKYSDNPNIRSNFAISVRTVGRFYRATEDFFRRVYRLTDKNVTLRTLYRLRLAHVGLEASGNVYEDQDGEPYIMMPMDDLIFKAINGPALALRGEPLIKNAQFNDFTLKLKMINPSFSPDAGYPALSGPIAGLGIIATKALLGKTGHPWLKEKAEQLDTFALGDLGDNIDIQRAVVPASLQRIWNALSLGEKNRQETTAVMQAIAYHQTQNDPLLPTATEQEKFDWLQQIRISANNVLFLRNVLGMILPVAPSSQESKGVPDYLLNVGITGLRPEFFDILQAITAKGDVEDPYELALATFIGKNPKKTIYTVSRDEKNTKFVIQKTEEVKSWAINNKKLIDKYGEAAWMLAPQVGDFNMGVYNWLEASGLLQDKSIEQYLQDVLVAEDKAAYYKIAQTEKDLLSNTISISERRKIIKDATRAREVLKTGNPLLSVALTGGGNEIATEEKLLDVLSEMIDDQEINIPKETRTKMKIAINSVKDFVAFANDPGLENVINPVGLKKEKKEQLLANLEELAAGDPAIREAMRAVFRSLLNYYSRDTYVAIRGGY